MAFIHRVKPRLVVFSTGVHNRYHFPHPSVRYRYQKAHSQIYNTASCGGLSLAFNKFGGLSQNCYRETHHHIWQTTDQY